MLHRVCDCPIPHGLTLVIHTVYVWLFDSRFSHFSYDIHESTYYGFPLLLVNMQFVLLGSISVILISSIVISVQYTYSALIEAKRQVQLEQIYEEFPVANDKYVFNNLENQKVLLNPS